MDEEGASCPAPRSVLLGRASTSADVRVAQLKRVRVGVLELVSQIATCRSLHTVGRDVVVAVGPNALLCF